MDSTRATHFVLRSEPEITDDMVEAGVLRFLGIETGWLGESMTYIKLQRYEFREALEAALAARKET